MKFRENKAVGEREPGVAYAAAPGVPRSSSDRLAHVASHVPPTTASGPDASRLSSYRHWVGAKWVEGGEAMGVGTSKRNLSTG